MLCKIVKDNLLSTPLLIGQSYTEQPHINVYKTASLLQFPDISKEMPSSDLDLNDESPLKES